MLPPKVVQLAETALDFTNDNDDRELERTSPPDAGNAIAALAEQKTLDRYGVAASQLMNAVKRVGGCKPTDALNADALKEAERLGAIGEERVRRFALSRVNAADPTAVAAIDAACAEGRRRGMKLARMSIAEVVAELRRAENEKVAIWRDRVWWGIITGASAGTTVVVLTRLVPWVFQLIRH